MTPIISGIIICFVIFLVMTGHLKIDFEFGVKKTINSKKHKVEYVDDEQPCRMTHEQWLLNKLAEEASEVAQIALKTAQFGMTERHPNMVRNNKERVHQELNDLLAVVDELNSWYGFEFSPDHKAKIAKIQKMNEFLGYSIQLGKVEDPEIAYQRKQKQIEA